MIENKKHIVIIEGADHTGKSELANYLRYYSNGKCHILHSNYNKAYPGENNYKQHKLMSKFAVKQFNKKYYTGNSLVILDRNYISDITYGKLGYGSSGTEEYKFKRLNKILKTITKDKNIKVTIIYCNPSKDDFNKNTREELLTNSEYSAIRQIYNEFFDSFDFKNIVNKYDNLFVYEYDYCTDAMYKQITKYIYKD